MIKDTQTLHGLFCGPSKPAIVCQGEVLAEAYAQTTCLAAVSSKCSTDTLNRCICVTHPLVLSGRGREPYLGLTGPGILGQLHSLDAPSGPQPP